MTASPAPIRCQPSPTSLRNELRTSTSVPPGYILATPRIIEEIPRFPIFRTIDGFVRRRLRALLRKREKRPSFGGSRQDHQRWPNAFFAAHGLFTLHEAYVQARQSR